MRGYRGWLLANTLGVTLMIAIAEIDKWRWIHKGWYNRPSAIEEIQYVRAFFAFAVLLGALQVAICYAFARAIPIYNRILGASCGILTGIVLPFFGVFIAHRLLSIYGLESLMCVFVLLPIGAVAGAITARTTPRS